MDLTSAHKGSLKWKSFVINRDILVNKFSELKKNQAYLQINEITQYALVF